MIRRGVLTALGVVGGAVIACGSTVGTIPVPDPPPPDPTPEPRPLTFPRDEGPHDDRLEWWYYNGRLEDESGREFGFHFVIFQSLDSEGSQTPGYAAQFGVIDLANGTHVHDARFSTGAQPQDGPGLSGLEVADWSLSAVPALHRFQASVGDTSLSLSMSPTKPPALHNDIGWLAGPTTGWTYYYSRPRMSAEGVLQLDGQDVSVSGNVWMDHQWGDFFVLGHPAGWQWFGIQLDDGSEIMVTETRDVEGEIDALYGSLISPEGSLTDIPPRSGQIALATSGTWTSPHTGASYPNRWRIEVPGEEIILDVVPVLEDQEITATRPESAIYWEGAVSVSGTRNGLGVTGKGFVELTGYVIPPPIPWR